jgi:inner membrane protein involved in colicin E2 resistance
MKALAIFIVLFSTITLLMFFFVKTDVIHDQNYIQYLLAYIALCTFSGVISLIAATKN